MKKKLFLPLFVILFGLPVPSARADVEACLACHPVRSTSNTMPAVPYLAGQHPEYIIDQLERFAVVGEDGSAPRTDLTMSPMAHTIPQEEWKQIAEALAAHECINLGNAELKTFTPNPCAVCHGARGLSEDPAVPNLAGQNTRYLFAQYEHFIEQYSPSFPVKNLQGGENRLHPDMGPIAAQVREDVISILNYYSNLPCR